MSVRITKKKDVVKNTDFGHILKCKNYGKFIKSKIMILYISILVYLISVAVWTIIYYYDSKETIHTIGDLLDEMEGFIWLPLLNTVLLVIVGLNVLWKKVRNIKLK